MTAAAGELLSGCRKGVLVRAGPVPSHVTDLGRTTERERIPGRVRARGVVLGVSEGLVYQLLDKGLLPELPRWSRRRLFHAEPLRLSSSERWLTYNPEDVLRATLS